MLDHFEEGQDIVLLIDGLRYGETFDGLVQILQSPSLLEERVLSSMSFCNGQDLAAGINGHDAARAWQSRRTLCEDASATANVEISESGCW